MSSIRNLNRTLRWELSQFTPRFWRKSGTLARRDLFGVVSVTGPFQMVHWAGAEQYDHYWQRCAKSISDRAGNIRSTLRSKRFVRDSLSVTAEHCDGGFWQKESAFSRLR